MMMSMINAYFSFNVYFHSRTCASLTIYKIQNLEELKKIYVTEDINTYTHRVIGGKPATISISCRVGKIARNMRIQWVDINFMINFT